MGDILKFEKKPEPPIIDAAWHLGWNDEGKMTINGKVMDLSTTGYVSVFDLKE